jgi:hypothetical protein
MYALGSVEARDWTAGPVEQRSLTSTCVFHLLLFTFPSFHHHASSSVSLVAHRPSFTLLDSLSHPSTPSLRIPQKYRARFPPLQSAKTRTRTSSESECICEPAHPAARRLPAYVPADAGPTPTIYVDACTSAADDTALRETVRASNVNTRSLAGSLTSIVEQ